MDSHHEIAAGYWKMLTAWALMGVGAFSLTQFLTIMALCCTIVYTCLQIWKIWRDIRKDRAAEAFAAKLAAPVQTGPGAL